MSFVDNFLFLMQAGRSKILPAKYFLKIMFTKEDYCAHTFGNQTGNVEARYSHVRRCGTADYRCLRATWNNVIIENS